MSVPASDPGLQPERTALAWRRTTASLLLCSVAGARVLGPVLGRWALVAGLAGLLTTSVVAVLTARRHDRTRRRRPADGRAPAFTAALVLTGGVLGVVFVVVRAVA